MKCNLSESEHVLFFSTITIAWVSIKWNWYSSSFLYRCVEGRVDASKHFIILATTLLNCQDSKIQVVNRRVHTLNDWGMLALRKYFTYHHRVTVYSSTQIPLDLWSSCLLLAIILSVWAFVVKFLLLSISPSFFFSLFQHLVLAVLEHLGFHIISFEIAFIAAQFALFYLLLYLLLRFREVASHWA